MTTLAATGFAQVALPAGSILLIGGRCAVRLAPPYPVYMSPGPFIISEAEDRIGPFPVAVTLNISAGPEIVTYQALAPTDEAALNAAGGRFPGLSATQASTAKIRIGLAFITQSVERGQVLDADRAAYPLCFASAKNKAVFAPLPGEYMPQTANSPFRYVPYGGMWYSVYDTLWTAGYDLQIFNSGIGSISLIRDVCGQVATRANSTGYRAKRAAVAGTEDRGFAGDCIVQTMSGAQPGLFRCTTGNASYAFYNSFAPPAGFGTPAAFNYLRTASGLATAGAPPVFTGATNVGDTVADGTIVWTLEVINTTFTSAQIFTEGQAGYGFDPYGIIARTVAGLLAIPAVFGRLVIIQTAQGDIGATGANYSTAQQAIATALARRGITVLLGLSSFSSGAGSTANYDALTTGNNTSISTLQGTPPASTAAVQFQAGANLYTLMGSTGAMAAAGAYMQADNIHLNGAGSLAAAPYEAAVILAALSAMGVLAV